MATVNIAQAKAHFSELVARALLGEEVIIARDNRPILRLVPLERPAGPRHPGSARGQILEIAQDFDALPEGFEDLV